MYLLLDPCFFSHSEELYRNKIFDIRPILENFYIGTTESIKNEILNFKLNQFFPISKFVIFPLELDDFQESRKKNPLLKELDNADQSLWIIGNKKKNSDDKPLILTDDGSLLLECKISNIRALNLPNFLLFLVRNGKISKNDVLFRCFRFWNKKGRFSKHDLKHWKQDLNNLR